MKRRDGFDLVNVPADAYNDPRVRQLVREMSAENALVSMAAVHLWFATLFASWLAGERLLATDAAPLLIPDVGAAIGACQRVGLLDADGRLPEQDWTEFQEADARRAKSREKARQRAERGRQTQQAMRNGTAADITDLSGLPPVERY